MDNSTKIGTYTGNGAAKNISLGFVPDYVMLINVTDGDLIHNWFAGIHAEGASTDIGAAAVANADNAISSYAGSATLPAGFTVGTDASENGKVYGYLAIRTSSGV